MKDGYSLQALIVRLEAATEGSRELDARIEATINPRQTGDYVEEMAADEPVWLAPYYTTSLDAALTLVLDGRDFDVGTIDGKVQAHVMRKMTISEMAKYGDDEEGAGWIAISHSGSSPALALCIPALKARMK